MWIIDFFLLLVITRVRNCFQLLAIGKIFLISVDTHELNVK